MANDITVQKQLTDLRRLLNCFPVAVVQALVRVASSRNVAVYIVGGTIRDWLLGRIPHDLDLTVVSGAGEFCRSLMRELGAGTFVQLGTSEEDAARVVWNGLDIDISSFRGGATQLTEDLELRDFSINSLAVDLVVLADSAKLFEIIDPLSGLADLECEMLRHCPRAFQDDPLRLLRAYRFMATLGFALDKGTRNEIAEHADKIESVAAERVLYELNLIMQTGQSADVLWQMHESGLLRYILPELYEGIGVEQPNFHHLDVFHHNFQALRELECLLTRAEDVYPEASSEVVAYLTDTNVLVCLKWAALFHDVGKPAVAGIAETGPLRVTFHAHDEVGKRQFEALAKRLKWSNEERDRTASLIAMHMHPFHLCNILREEKLSARAALRLCRRAGANLPGLFLLAMSDSLASKGELKPEKMEDELIHLYREVATIYRENIQPALSGPPLLRGSDLIECFGLKPGPIFSIILEELQNLQVEGKVVTQEDALEWVRHFVIKQEGKQELKRG